MIKLTVSNGGRVPLAAVVKALRELGYEVFIHEGRDAYTYPVDPDRTLWIITAPAGDYSALAHELGHIWLAANGYEIFGLSIGKVLEDVVADEDLPGLQMIFNVVADAAVELVLHEWGYSTTDRERDMDAYRPISERHAGAELLLYIYGLLPEEQFEFDFPENTWQNKMMKKLHRVYVDKELSLEEKLDKFVEIMNEFLPFSVDKHLNFEF